MSVCTECGRPATFVTRKDGHHRARKDHDMCGRCWQKQRDRDISSRLKSKAAYAGAQSVLRSTLFRRRHHLNAPWLCEAYDALREALR